MCKLFKRIKMHVKKFTFKFVDITFVTKVKVVIVRISNTVHLHFIIALLLCKHYTCVKFTFLKKVNNKMSNNSLYHLQKKDNN